MRTRPKTAKHQHSIKNFIKNSTKYFVQKKENYCIAKLKKILNKLNM
jgi:hypothetical protein